MTLNSETYQHYLHDLGILIKEEAFEMKEKNSVEKENLKDASYEEGYLMGLHRIITLMQQQAEAFNIPLDKISLHDIDPYKDLL